MATKSHKKTQRKGPWSRQYPIIRVDISRLFVSSCAFSWPSFLSAQPFTFDDIEFWVGTGANRAALVIDWVEGSTEPPALVWGYRWDGTARGSDMLTAIVAADPRLFAKLGGTPSNPMPCMAWATTPTTTANSASTTAPTFDAADCLHRPGRSGDGDRPRRLLRRRLVHRLLALRRRDSSGTNPYDGGSWSDIAGRHGGPHAGRRRMGQLGVFADVQLRVRSPRIRSQPPPPFSPGDFNHDGQRRRGRLLALAEQRLVRRRSSTPTATRTASWMRPITSSGADHVHRSIRSLSRQLGTLAVPEPTYRLQLISIA